MATEVAEALREVRDELLSNPVSPRVDAPRDINLRYCRYVAETVADRLGPDRPVAVLEDGGRGFVHTWLAVEGRHYDAECVEGVDDYRDLPFFRRHPEAAVHVEVDRPDLAALRAREREALYPPMFARDPAFAVSPRAGPTDRRLALVGVAVGLVLVVVGATLDWSVQQQLLDLPRAVETRLVAVGLLGAVLALTSPVLFVLVRPAHRASIRH